jgi:hypothetical protein
MGAVFFALAALLVIQPVSQADTSAPLAPQFSDVTQALGLDGLAGNQVAAGDFDNDGWIDLYDGQNLWRNERGKRFVKVPDLPLNGIGIWGDYDNDGFLDLYCWSNGKLFHNEHGKGFTDASAKVPKAANVSRGAAWGDFDGDGYLDLYVGGYEEPAYLPDFIFHNNRDGSFSEVWREQGRMQPARGITAADFDEDGDLDIYVSNYRLEPNLLWLNEGKGVFTDVATPYGVAGDGELGAWGHTIGSAFGDFDNDGHFDLFVGNFSHPPEYQDRPKFLRNLGPRGKWHFEDKSALASLRWQESYASPTLGDFDNDGLLDLFFTTVYPGDKSVLYRNLGDWKFSEVPQAGGIATELTYQATWVDYDNDGDLDLLSGGKLWQNAGNKHHWLKVRLKVERGQARSGVNSSAIGTQVRIKLGNRVLARQVEGATGEGSQNDLTLHFGLGSFNKRVELEIVWPDGKKQTVRTRIDRTVEVKH